MKKANNSPPLPAHLEKEVRRHFSNAPLFHHHLGMRLVQIKKGWAQLEIAISPMHLNVFKDVHGGVIFSLSDSAMGAALVGLLEEAEGMTTVEAKINYLRPVTGGLLRAEAEVIHKGRRSAVLEARVTDSDGKDVAIALGTYLILEERASHD